MGHAETKQIGVFVNAFDRTFGLTSFFCAVTLYHVVKKLIKLKILNNNNNKEHVTIMYGHQLGT